MLKKPSTKRLVRRFALLTSILFCLATPLSAGSPHSAYYSPATDNLLWFIHASDTHMGTSGSTDSTNLAWLVGEATSVISPSFIVVTGDLTDSTNGNLFGYPNGPWQDEWNQYKSIVDGRVTADFYFDIPGNHDAYNDQYFAYYLANSVQGRATGRTQASWTRSLSSGAKYHFLGINSADNTGASFSILWPYGDYAGLDSGELSFLSSELNNNLDASLTLIFGHHPLAATGDSQDTYLFYGKDEFVSLMDTEGASLYGYGHTHASSESFYDINMTDGVFYFNVSALGKDSPNQYTLTAIDCNGISSVTQNAGAWPVVLITAPMDRRLGNLVNPYAYTVNNGVSNPIRALVFDRSSVSQVRFRVNSGGWVNMSSVSGNTNLWQGIWDASTMTTGECTIEVEATSGSGVRSNAVTTYVNSTVLPKAGVTVLETGKYVTSGSGKSKTTQFVATQTFNQGETIIVRATVKNTSGTALAGATVSLSVSGPSTPALTPALSNSSGIAEASWTTTAPSKRGQGTATGGYTVTVTKVTATGHVWDGVNKTVSFSLNSK